MCGLFEVDSKIKLKKYLDFTYSVNKQVFCKILLSLVDERVFVLIIQVNTNAQHRRASP